MTLLKIDAGVCGMTRKSRNKKLSSLPLFAAFTLFALPAGLVAQQAPVNLGTSGNFVILSETGITDVSPSPITGNIGSSPITGAAILVSCAEVTGTIFSVDSAGPSCAVIDPAGLGQAVLDMQAAYTDAAGRTTPDFVELGEGNISGMTLTPGLYKWSTGVSVDNTGFTLSGGPNAVWIFQVAGDLLLANNAIMNLAGGARASNIFWQLAGPTGATFGTGAAFSGNILSSHQVILGTGASLNGRALAATQVTLQMSTVTSPGILVGGVPVPIPPTVSSTSPAELAIAVPVGNALSATFSETMNPSTITSGTFTLQNGLISVPGTVSYLGVTASFTPLSPLLPNTIYTATITTDAQDPAGVGLAANYVWSFTTAAVVDTTPPTVSSTTPAGGATNVPVGNALSATFSEAMNPLTINTSTFTLTQAGTPVTGTVGYAGVTATFTPTSNLAPSLPFTATITTGVTDLAGNALVTNYVWTFTTGAIVDTTPPTVSSTTPASGATNVPVGNALSATFSEAMNPLTINTSTFTLTQAGTPVAGTVSYAGVTATFTPAGILAPSLPFTATITTGVTDLAGNALVTNYIWSFTTGAIVDTTPPTVSSTTPASGATNVPVGNALSATFSEAMNPLTINTSTFTVTQAGTPVTGTVSYVGVTATFTPAANLPPSLPFTATITTGVTDLAGNALVTNYVWTFTTGAIVDTTPPTVSSTTPASGATNVPVGNALSATFSEAMNPLTINTSTFTLTQAGTPVTGTVGYAGVTATFTPTSNLAPSLPFTATITTGVTDLAGNALVTNYVWTFTTGAIVDTTPPTVSSTAPASGATNVPVGNALSATFSEAMNPLTINTSTFTLTQAGAPVAGTVSYAGVTATFTPASNLSASLPFTATITTGVTDLAGNALVANYTWTFTTGAIVDTTPPTVSSTVAANGATNVPVNSLFSATFSEPMNPLTINTSTFTLTEAGVAVAGTVTYSGLTATFTPATSLKQGVSILATITTAAKNLAGVGLAANFTWTFTTAPAATPIRPAVISTAPLAGATLTTLTSNVVANFSEVMNSQTIGTATFLLNTAGFAVPGTVTYAGTSATFRPTSDLTPNTSYTATITIGATDQAGNALAADYVWTFTTGSAGGQAPICLPDFAVLSRVAVINSGDTTVTGDVGVSPGGSISGFPPGVDTGSMHQGDSVAGLALSSASAAYADAVSRSSARVAVAGDIGGQTFTAGLYTSTSSLAISAGDITLDAKGDPNAIFIFQMATTLSTGAGRQIVLAGGAQGFNVFWQVGTTATLGANSTFVGSILADQSITLGAGVSVNGRLSAITGTITLDTDAIASPPPSIAIGGVLNAASATAIVAPGSIASVFGTDLASTLTIAMTSPLPTTLEESSFEIGMHTAPLYMTSCGQANLQIPWETAGQATVPVTATVAGQVSSAQSATIAAYAPGIFTLSQTGAGQGAVEIAPTGEIAGPSATGARPVMRGEYIAIFCTGLGPVSNQPGTGASALSNPLSSTTTLPVVTIGGVAAQVVFSGLAPDFVGLYQVNALVPQGAPSGSAVSVLMTIGGVASNTVTIAVQ